MWHEQLGVLPWSVRKRFSARRSSVGTAGPAPSPGKSILEKKNCGKKKKLNSISAFKLSSHKDECVFKRLVFGGTGRDVVEPAALRSRYHSACLYHHLWFQWASCGRNWKVCEVLYQITSCTAHLSNSNNFLHSSFLLTHSLRILTALHSPAFPRCVCAHTPFFSLYESESQCL